MKGMVELVEVVIGMLAVFSIFLLLYQPEAIPDLKPGETKVKILNFLVTLDEQEKLANLVLTNNTTAIVQELQAAFPSLNFEVRVDGDIPSPSNNTYSIVYFIPGNYTYFKPSKLTVYTWFS